MPQEEAPQEGEEAASQEEVLLKNSQKNISSYSKMGCPYCVDDKKFKKDKKHKKDKKEKKKHHKKDKKDKKHKKKHH